VTVGNVGVNAILVIRSISGDRAQRAGDLVKQRPNLGRIVHLSLLVSAAATIWPVAASTPRGNFRHDRRVVADKVFRGINQ